MAWERRGLLIPAPVPVDWAVSHAALPIPAARRDGSLRVYFSARDASGRSQIGAADLSELGVEASLAFSKEPLLRIGPPGGFDDNGVTSSCLVEHEGRQFLYYSGWTTGVTTPFRFFVGCAVSDDDGQTFEKVSAAPVLPPSDVDPFLTASPWVLFEDGRWRMWYVSGTGWEDVGAERRPHYNIKYAESRDGITWRRDGHVCVDFADTDEYAFGRPCVLREDAGYRMWFCVRGPAYRLGYAESEDGLHWERNDGEVALAGSPDRWEAEMQAYPAVVDHEGARHLLYNGNGYGSTGIGHAVLRQ